MDDGRSVTLKSATPSISEKAHEAGVSSRETSASPSPSVVQDEINESNDVHSAQETKVELSRIMTSGEGVEYPTGVKLGLISLALCLSVFLMALVRTAFFNSASCHILTSKLGQYYHCNCYPENYGSVSQST